ncbi:DUF6249 domain-containing protein [Pedobacter sp. SYP-B3415]|uniref:DUF6249 domain-containing protein n=1 Tax=Pedobacter sp. SYP-B3415 TaxID=2496641 RepID=UPI001F106E27|nr:DUF6249 domain-containing protein [Pedobacter sp. SYP-B3415]
MEPLIPISLFLGAFAMVFGIRYLSNKEKMAMIERGIDPGIGQAQPKPYTSLKFGLLLIGLGLGLLVALVSVRAFLGEDPNEGQATAIYFGCLSIFGGLGLIVSFLIEKKTLSR